MRTKPRWFAYPAIDELAGFFALAMGGSGQVGRGDEGRVATDGHAAHMPLIPRRAAA